MGQLRPRLDRRRLVGPVAEMGTGGEGMYFSMGTRRQIVAFGGRGSRWNPAVPC